MITSFWRKLRITYFVFVLSKHARVTPHEASPTIPAQLNFGLRFLSPNRFSCPISLRFSRLNLHSTLASFGLAYGTLFAHPADKFCNM